MNIDSKSSIKKALVLANSVVLSSRSQQLLALGLILAICFCMSSDSVRSELNRKRTHLTRGIRLSNASQIAVQQPTSTTLEYANTDLAIDLGKMEQHILDDLTGNAVGFAYVISQNGMPVISGAQGWAKRPVDGAVPMTIDTRIQTASISKTVSAVSTLQLLKANQLSVDDPIAEWLPAAWEQGAGIQQLTFRHLLTHRSGFKQLFNSMNKSEQAQWGNDWDGLQFIISNGAQADAEYADDNANYALFRIIIPQLWKAVGTQFNITTINKWNHGMWYLSYIQQHIFIPSGIESVTCWEQAGYPAAYAYQLGYPNQSGHSVDSNIFNCGGHTGLHLSALELANVMAQISQDDSILSAANRSLMDTEAIGWNKYSDTSSLNQLETVRQGGDLTTAEGHEIHACMMRYHQNIVASLVINSAQTSGKNQCSILENAFDNALD